jgi:intracellular septation protein
VVDYGPIAVFFVTYAFSDLFAATGALMAATAVALLLSLAVERRVPVMPLLTAGVVGVFGGLTLWLEDETFIKMKPTIIQGIFAIVLLGGLVARRPLLKSLLGSTISMDETGWRTLTVRYALFFVGMAALNEAVWRTQSTDFWVAFKVFGIIGLTVLFAVLQVPTMMRHQIETAAAEVESGRSQAADDGH